MAARIIRIPEIFGPIIRHCVHKLQKDEFVLFPAVKPVQSFSLDEFVLGESAFADFFLQMVDEGIYIGCFPIVCHLDIEEGTIAFHFY